MPPRRESVRESVIPFRAAAAPPRRDRSAEHEAETGRRRPSFKIDLPPRPIPVEILHSVHTSIHTPYPTKAGAHVTLAQKTANNTALNAHTPEAYYRAASPAPGAQLRATVKRARGPTFAAEDADIISHPAPERERNDAGQIVQATEAGQWHDLASPKAEPWGGAGIVGLGYTLNKLRAPTPWIRGKVDEGEWLTTSDVEDLHEGTRGLSLA